ncbi:MAG: hypothetical protein QOG14_3473 [Mycobacterium sp.]|nr:hypothetical protein [Mycobacterium sp.]
MAGRCRHTFLGSASPRRAAPPGRSCTGAAAPGATRCQAPASVRPTATGSPPCRGRRSGRCWVDLLVLVAGRQPAACRRGKGRQGRADAGGPFVRRMVRVGEARRGAGSRVSCCCAGRICRSRERQGCRCRRANCRRGDGVASVDRRRRPSELLRLVFSRQHRPDPGPGPCPPFRHGGAARTRPWRRRQGRPLGRVGGGRDQVADDADRGRCGHPLS